MVSEARGLIAQRDDLHEEEGVVQISAFRVCKPWLAHGVAESRTWPRRFSDLGTQRRQQLQPFLVVVRGCLCKHLIMPHPRINGKLHDHAVDSMSPTLVGRPSDRKRSSLTTSIALDRPPSSDESFSCRGRLVVGTSVDMREDLELRWRRLGSDSRLQWVPRWR